MGDRGNIIVDDKIYLYTHWGGSALRQTLKDALIRGKGRWSDKPYLIRIIFSEMIKDDIEGDTGFGIDYEMGDGGTEIYIDSAAQTVRYEDELNDEYEETFEEFIGEKKKSKKEIKEFEDTIEMAELKALSTTSLERPLEEKEYKRMKLLGKKIFGGKK